jgi:hypothetical protein
MLSTEGVNIGNVVFEPGCRNHWHIHHKGGQILLVTGGRGWYQEWNQPARELTAGDVVNIPRASSTGTARPPIAGLPISPLPSLPKVRLTNGWSRSPTTPIVSCLKHRNSRARQLMRPALIRRYAKMHLRLIARAPGKPLIASSALCSEALNISP